MIYPVFDSNFTFWLADVETLLMETYGLSLKEYSASWRKLAEYFYSGMSPHRAIEKLLPSNNQ